MSPIRRLFIIGGLALASLIITVAPTAASLNAAEDARPMQSHDFTDVPFPGKEFMELTMSESSPKTDENGLG